MTTTSQTNGNKINAYISSNIKTRGLEYIYWYYEDGEEYTGINSRPCPKCGKMPTKEGHDSCLGTLPGVLNACCGHGGQGYIQFTNGVTLRFDNLKIENRTVGLNDGI